jgi:hypothetical protein
MSPIYLYELDPIDWWMGWLTEEQYQEQFDEAASQYGGGWYPNPYPALRERALELARKIGWEGDFREGPFVASLPVDDGSCACPVMMAWKQDNNGQTFIASPFPLPWLGSPKLPKPYSFPDAVEQRARGLLPQSG